jgi:dihydrofolate reductase
MSSEVDRVTNKGRANSQAVEGPDLSFVVAIADNGVIGSGGSLPWHLPADLKHFKALTIGKPVLMGRKTFESIGKTLVERQNIVLTRDRRWRAPDVTVAHTLDEAIRRAQSARELMVIGGAEIYRLCLPHCSRIYLTEVHGQFDGDTHFPELLTAEWRECEREDHPADERHAYAYSFRTLERIT